MMEPATRENLERLVDRVDELLAAMDAKLGEPPSFASSDYSFEVMSNWWDRERKALDELRDTLRRDEGARYRDNPPNGHHVTLAGISSSSTSGWRGAFGNWKTAARRRIEKAAAA